MRQKCCSQLQRFVESRDNDVDVELCGVIMVSLLHYLTFRKYRKLKYVLSDSFVKLSDSDVEMLIELWKNERALWDVTWAMAT